MLVAIAAIAVLQTLVILFVVGLLFESQANTFLVRRSEARRRHYEPHVLGLLLNPSDIGELQRAVPPWDRRLVRNILLQQSEQLKGIDKDNMTDVFERLGYVKQEFNYLKSIRWWCRLEAVVNLGNMKSQDAAQPLMAAVKDSNEDVRLAAVRSLGHLGTAQGLRVLLDALEDDGNWTAVKIVEILVGIGPDIESEIVPRLSVDRSVKSRMLSVELCGYLRLISSVALIRKLADDQDPAMRTAVAKALGKIGHNAALGTLNILLADPEKQVRSEAARALGGLDAMEMSEDLRQALDDPDWQVRRNAVASLRRIGPSGSDMLQSASDSGTPGAQQAAAHIIELGRLGVPVIG